ncbi:MAG: 16S rRNA (cytosine(1402)-N(4))-methyltransferase RsmH [Candidatus Paceibacterota bacterium]
MHKPVLLKEVIDILNPQPGEFFIDGTLGGGGHAAEIIKRISPNGMFLGIDQDRNAVENFQQNIEPKTQNLKTIKLFQGNYADIPEILKSNKLPKADGLIVDLGLSSDQLENSARGFSFLKNEILDMRFDPESGRQTAAEIVNSLNEKELADVFWKYGEERNSRRIVKEIVERRRKNRIKTTFELAEIVESVVPRRSKIHPATKVFQALRIYVNDELGNLERLLGNLGDILAKGGRAAIISFHSLEDRLVKNSFRNMAKGGRVEILTKKPVVPSQEEIKNNQRSRSSKLRAIIYDNNSTA